jgi:hypothetical protein
MGILFIYQNITSLCAPAEMTIPPCECLIGKAAAFRVEY